MKNDSKLSFLIFRILIFMIIISIVVYLFFRSFLFVTSGDYWVERVIGLGLFLSEMFILIHSLGYFLNLYLVKTQAPTQNSSSTHNLTYFPPIAIIVPSYQEPIEVLRDTLVCLYNVTYPNKYLYLLDDTRYDLPWDTPENKQKYRRNIEELCEWLEINLFRAEWHGAKAGIINDFLQFLEGNHRPDFEFYPYQKKEKKEKEKYLIVFDADMNPLPDFAEKLTALMESNSKLAFIQTPQYYTNFETNRVARAAGVQQAIFYEYICEGKSLKNAMFCCGTNIIYRIEALMQVGGMEENSVTEDYVTSLKFHRNDWQSLYINKVLAFGIGPSDLGAFFKQQFRWATGTVGVLRMLIPQFFTQTKQFSIGQWWEYFLASTHYLIGWAIFFMILSPLCFLLFNIPAYFTNPFIFTLAYLPYITLSLFVFFSTILEKKYRFSDILSALLITISSFSVFIKASFYALMGVKTSFGVTAKTGTHVLPFKFLILQLITVLSCVFAFSWGAMRLYYEREPFYAILTNMFWTLFNAICLSFFLYFNHSEEKIRE